MEIVTIEPFLAYYQKIRERTLKVIACIPPDKIEWTYQNGKFTLGDLIRHLACIERFMYAENAQFLPSRYQGCGREYAEGYENVLNFFNQMHQESLEIFRKLSPEDLQRKTFTPASSQIALWKWLRAMTEHEIHHRGQIYLYLGILQVPTPPLYGLTAEQVQTLSLLND
ncbi:MAG: DinB family protein [Microscillaceae bacterium]|jgi:uncharacterized damage-inducible protein DinB|nr:DinB family protein [Microscillaceae bacterium]